LHRKAPGFELDCHAYVMGAFLRQSCTVPILPDAPFTARVWGDAVLRVRITLLTEVMLLFHSEVKTLQVDVPSSGCYCSLFKLNPILSGCPASFVAPGAVGRITEVVWEGRGRCMAVCNVSSACDEHTLSPTGQVTGLRFSSVTVGD
jgi:hypothetical protein